MQLNNKLAILQVCSRVAPMHVSSPAFLAYAPACDMCLLRSTRGGHQLCRAEQAACSTASACTTASTEQTQSKHMQQRVMSHSPRSLRHQIYSASRQGHSLHVAHAALHPRSCSHCAAGLASGAGACEGQAGCAEGSAAGGCSCWPPQGQNTRVRHRSTAADQAHSFRQSAGCVAARPAGCTLRSRH
jgi:hypothetical protein